MAKRYAGRVMLSDKLDRYISVLEDGNHRHPLWYDARQEVNKVMCCYLEDLIGATGSVNPVHSSDKTFKFVRKNRPATIEYSFQEALDLFKDLLTTRSSLNT